MLITLERVWAVGRFDVGRSLFVVPQQPRAVTVANRRCFLASPGHTKPQRAKKGYFPNLVETAGYTLTQAFQKGVLSHTPLLITPIHPQYTREKKLNTLNGWEEPGEHDKRCCIFLFDVDLMENMGTSPSAKRFVPPFVKVFFGGCAPSCQMLFFQRNASLLRGTCKERR